MSAVKLKSWNFLPLIVLCLGLAACATEPPPVHHAPAPTAPPAIRLDCSFDDGGSPQFRTYQMRSGSLRETGPSHRRLKIVSDDGETIIAEHIDRNGASSRLTIDLRRHEATLVEASSAAEPGRTLSGTCAQGE